MSIQVASFFQDKDESVVRTINWQPDLNGSTISSVTWVLPAGITQDAVSNTTLTASIRISGGTPGFLYTVICRVVTAASETLEVFFTLTIGN